MSRGCPLVVDLGGYSYFLQPDRPDFVSRRRNRAWQSMAVDYLRSGDVTVGLRFDGAHGYSRAAVRTIGSWPLLARAGKVTARRPRQVAERSVALPQLGSGSSR